jgi:hypothetical protein
MARIDKYPDLRLDRIQEVTTDDPSTFHGLFDADNQPIMAEIPIYIYHFLVFKDKYHLRVMLKKKNIDEAMKRAVKFCDKHRQRIDFEIAQINKKSRIIGSH